MRKRHIGRLSKRRGSVSRWIAAVLFIPAAHLVAQVKDDGLRGPDSHESQPEQRAYLFGDWSGKRTRLRNRGVSFDLQYVADHLSNIRSSRKERLASWNRVRGTMNIDLETLLHARGYSFHVTALWQGGGNLGTYLGTLSSPSGMSSGNTFRLDSWWIEKRFASDRIVGRIGQFAGQDFYGVQHYAASYILEPLGYAMGNLNANFESFDPPSTPALEFRVVPAKHLYVKEMAFAADRNPYTHNPTGLVPQFRGALMTASEIGITAGQAAAETRAFDSIETRKGYTGLYRFGGTYNPGKFQSTASSTPVGGNYLIYAMATQALWRPDRRLSRGLDATFAINYTPPDRSRVNQETTAGLRYNEALPIRWHNTVDVGYVRNNVNWPGSLSPTQARDFKSAEHAVEMNVLLKPTGWFLLQPVVQHFVHVGGKAGSATVFGFRSKVEF